MKKWVTVKIIFNVIICVLLLSSCSIDGRDRVQINDLNSLSKENGSIISRDKAIEDEIRKRILEDTSKTDVSESDNSSMRYTTLYYQDGEGLLIPITRRTARIEGIGKAAVSALFDVPVIREDIGRVGLYPVLPRDTNIHGMTIKNGTAVVDLNENILSYEDLKQEQNILNAIVYTLAEFHTIDDVQILINGQRYNSLKFGSPIDSPLKNKGINSIGDVKEGENIDMEQVEVYFTKLVNSKYLYYVPVSRTIRRPTSDIDRYIETLNMLIKAEVGDTGLKSYVPADSILKGIQVEGQTVILDFNDALLNATSTDTSFNIMLKQILLCFKQFGKVKKIKATINGKPLEFPETYAGKEDLEVPEYINVF